MKKLLIFTVTVATFTLTGCGNPGATKSAQQEKDAKPTFMFWCFRKEVLEEHYYVPQLTDEQTARYLHAHLKTLPGLVDVKFNLSTQTITVKYTSSTIRKMNIEDKIAESGFSVNGRPANPTARLPDGV